MSGISRLRVLVEVVGGVVEELGVVVGEVEREERRPRCGLRKCGVMVVRVGRTRRQLGLCPLRKGDRRGRARRSRHLLDDGSWVLASTILGAVSRLND
jgi:hypothetical protein